MPRSLEEVMADWLDDANVFERHGQLDRCKTLRKMHDEVKESAEDYLKFLSEKDAALKCGKALAWLRKRFAEWEREGNAKMVNGVRYYRSVVLPQRANESAAFEEGRRAARGEDKAA